LSSKAHLGTAVLLAMTIALAPFSLDTYLPAFPFMAESLNTSVEQISLSIGVYVFTIALGQLIGGPLADKHGRALVMTSGLILFAASSFLLSRATSLHGLLLLRMIQAFGGGFATVCVSAIVRDLFSGKEAARFFSSIGLIMILAPAVAPTLGSALLMWSGWRGIFVFLTIYALVLLPGLYFGLLSKLNKTKSPMAATSMWAKYRAVLSVRKAMPFLFIQTLSFTVMLIFISHSSFIYQQHYGASPQLFAALFAANIGLMMVMNLGNRVALNRFSPVFILRCAQVLQCIGILLLIAVLLFYPTLELFVPAMVITIGSMGAITPNSQASFMEYFEELGGTAAAVLGACQFALAALITSAATIILPQTVGYIVGLQAVFAFASLFIGYAFASDELPFKASQITPS